MSNIENIQLFNKFLDIARNRLDLSTEVGKKIDNFLTSLYKKYGYYDERAQMININVSKINPNDINILSNDADKVLEFFDVHKTDILLASKTNPKIMDKYLHIKGYLQKISNGFTGTAKEAWHVYGMFAHIVELDKMIKDVLNASKDIMSEHNKEIAENLQQLLYYNYRNIDESVTIVATTFNITTEAVIESFKCHIGTTPIEYSETLIQEAFGDFAKSKLSGIGGKIASMAPVGQNRVISKAKTEVKQGTESVLKDWNMKTLGKPQAATVTSLTNYLVNIRHLDRPTADKIIKKYKPSFVKSGPITYLPSNFLRGLFYEAVYAARVKFDDTKSAEDQTQQTQKVGGIKKVKPTVVAPLQPIAPATASVQTQKMDVNAIVGAVAKLPANQRITAILQSLPHLTDDDIRKVLSALSAPR